MFCATILLWQNDWIDKVIAWYFYTLLVLGFLKRICKKNMMDGWWGLWMGNMRFHQFMIKYWWDSIKNLYLYYKTKFFTFLPWLWIGYDHQAPFLACSCSFCSCCWKSSGDIRQKISYHMHNIPRTSNISTDSEPPN